MPLLFLVPSPNEGSPSSSLPQDRGRTWGLNSPGARWGPSWGQAESHRAVVFASLTSSGAPVPQLEQCRELSPAASSGPAELRAHAGLCLRGGLQKGTVSRALKQWLIKTIAVDLYISTRTRVRVCIYIKRTWLLGKRGQRDCLCKRGWDGWHFSKEVSEEEQEEQAALSR